MAALKHAPVIGIIIPLAHRHVADIGTGGIALDYRVQDNRPLPLFRCQPLLGQQVRQDIRAALTGQLYLNILCVALAGVHQVRRRHDHDYIFLCRIVEQDLAALFQNGNQVAYIQGIAITL